MTKIFFLNKKLLFIYIYIWNFAEGRNVIINEDFEMGNLNGWIVLNQAGSSNESFYIDSGNTAPISGRQTVGVAEGIYYAISDEG